jgi:hypothetical protein
LAEFNPQFNLFAIDNIDFENFPPVENKYGTATVNGAVSVLLYSKIRNLETNSPLMFCGKPKAYSFLLGENSWKWNYKVMSKINPLINLMFLSTNNTVFWHPIFKKNHWLS